MDSSDLSAWLENFLELNAQQSERRSSVIWFAEAVRLLLVHPVSMIDGFVIRSAALVVCCGRDEAEVARRASNIGRDVDELSEDGLTGTPAQVVERILHFGELGISRLYLQVLDMKDLDHVRLIAEEVLPDVR